MGQSNGNMAENIKQDPEFAERWRGDAGQLWNNGEDGNILIMTKGSLLK